MKTITYTLAFSLTLVALSTSAAPRRRVVEHDDSSSQPHDRSPPQRRRRIIQTQAANHSSARPRQQRQAERRQQRQAERQAERRQQRQAEQRVERRQQRRVERRQRDASRSISRHHARRSRVDRHVNRRHRRLPNWVYAPPIRFIVDRGHRPQSNDDAFFDRVYHDGARYGINNDFRDEEHKIQRGIRKGLITPNEAQHLNKLLWDAYDLEDACIADGYLSQEEEADLYWAERDLNRAIRWEMRDFDTW